MNFQMIDKILSEETKKVFDAINDGSSWERISAALQYENLLQTKKINDTLEAIHDELHELTNRGSTF